MTGEQAKLEALEPMTEGFNAHDLDAIMSVFTDDCVFESPRGPDPWGHRFVGKEEMREGFAARFSGIPDVRRREALRRERSRSVGVDAHRDDR